MDEWLDGVEKRNKRIKSGLTEKLPLIDEFGLFDPKSNVGNKADEFRPRATLVQDGGRDEGVDDDGARATARWCSNIVEGAKFQSEDDEEPELVHRWDDDEDEPELKNSQGLAHAKDLLGKLPVDHNTTHPLENGGRRSTKKPPEVDCCVGVDCSPGTSFQSATTSASQVPSRPFATCVKPRRGPSIPGPPATIDEGWSSGHASSRPPKSAPRCPTHAV